MTRKQRLRRHKRQVRIMAAMSESQKQAEYLRRLNLERNQEWYWRHTKQGEFESSMVRLDQLEAGDKVRIIEHSPTLGDIAPRTKEEIRQSVASLKNKLDYACLYLQRIGKGYLVPTLRLIAKNGSNRKESICAMMIEDSKRHGKGTIDTSGNCA